MNKVKKKNDVKRIIGMTKNFEGYFDLYKTDNVFQFIKQTPQDMAKDIIDDIDGSVVLKYGRIQPRVKINQKGVIVGQLNKKEGLFIVKKYPLSIFRFNLKELKVDFNPTN